jgi:hypothetical protein
MANRWEMPGFRVVRVSAECTAYSGAEAIVPHPRVETVSCVETTRSPQLDQTQSEAKAPADGLSD